MKTTEIKTDLLKQIDGLSARQLKEVYGLFQNYVNGTEEWGLLTQQEKDRLDLGLAQANANESRPVSDVITRLRSKHSLNG